MPTQTSDRISGLPPQHQAIADLLGDARTPEDHATLLGWEEEYTRLREAATAGFISADPHKQEVRTVAGTTALAHEVSQIGNIHDAHYGSSRSTRA